MNYHLTKEQYEYIHWLFRGGDFSIPPSLPAEYFEIINHMVIYDYSLGDYILNFKGLWIVFLYEEINGKSSSSL